jgi:Cu/Zn superoxide dismutase
VESAGATVLGVVVSGAAAGGLYGYDGAYYGASSSSSVGDLPVVTSATNGRRSAAPAPRRERLRDRLTRRS